MGYESVTLRSSLMVPKIYSIHYFEYMSDFSFPGESHHFWEFLCVDKGEVDVVAGTRRYSLKKDEIIFHRPDEFHAVHSNGHVAPNLVVISFDCHSVAMDFFREKILTINEADRNLLAQIISECRDSFSTPLDDPYLQKMERTAHPPFGSEQMIRLLLEQFLVKLLRRYTTLHAAPAAVISKSLKGKNDSALYDNVLHYLESHLHSQLTIEQICKDNLVGRSQLQKLFREKNGCGIIELFTRMKIDAAKQLIRAKSLNFTQIADNLGYTSVHYFSRQFKKVTGMTPSEYSSSIKKLSEAPPLRSAPPSQSNPLL